MAVTFVTQNPSSLLKSFNDRIDQEEEKGKITTWEKVGDHFTHKAPQWHKKAYFLPKVADGELVFNIIKPKGKTITVPVYGYYHGHLIETFLNHFDSKFTSAIATAKAVTGDNVSASES